MNHPLSQLTRATPGIIEVWVSELLEPAAQSWPSRANGHLPEGTLSYVIDSLQTVDQAQYVVSLAYLGWYIRGLFDAYQTRGFQTLDLVYLRNAQDSVVAVFDCRRFLKISLRN